MQKSAHHNALNARRPARGTTDPSMDKGQKFEPFWNAAFGADRRSLARLQKADQKR